MLHDNKDEFLKILERTSAQTGFMLSLLEKDYYLTILLSDINSLSNNLVFKGGTCLNKVYYSYYRLSEDLDFSMKMSSQKITGKYRRNMIKPVKDKILPYIRKLGMRIKDTKNAGRNESKQYVYYVDYDSVVLNKEQSVKLEIGLRFEPILPAVNHAVNHKFLHPFTRELLFKAGTVNCLNLKELVAEKMRATATRSPIAPRDFFDLVYLIKSGFNFKDKELLLLFRKKLKEDGFDPDLKKYRLNMGRSENEIKEMNSRLGAELLDVLSLEERKKFSMPNTLSLINKAFRT